MSSDPRCGSRPIGLYSAIAVSLLLPSLAVHAGTVTGPGNSQTVGPGSDPNEKWTVSDGATLIVAGGSTNYISAASLATLRVIGGTVTAATVPVVQGGAIQVWGGSGAGATALIEDSVVTDTTGRALALRGVRLGPKANAVVNHSQLTGVVDGALVAGGGTLLIDRASTVTGTGASSSGVRISTGDVTLAGGSTIIGRQNGVVFTDDSRGFDDFGRNLVVDGAAVTGETGSGILLVPTSAQPTVATVTLSNGATVTGGNGIAVEAALYPDPSVSTTDSEVTVNVSDSDIVGDMVSRGGRFDLNLMDAATVTGRVLSLDNLSIQSGSTWNVTGDSDVRALTLSGGNVAFLHDEGAPPAALTVHGDLSGTGGMLTLNTVFNEGGALSVQSTDRLLIEGNVTTTGQTLVDVEKKGSAEGALTDTNGNGVVDPNEGISLIQVAGTSRADAFVLKGGYVAVGAYRYGLHALGPGQVDPSQSALAGGSLNWDYRLASDTCTGDGCMEPPPPPPPPPPPCEGEDCVTPPPPPPPPPERDRVVPQLPSYLSAPAALLTYGDMMNDGLRQRLGEIRSGESTSPFGGEVFARYLGGQLRYSSNRSFDRYGYDFDQQVNALQLGGSLIQLDEDAGTLRAGWAFDNGTTRVSPQAVDGKSSAKYRANGLSGWITWQAGSGWWIDAVVAAQRFSGDVGTDARGARMARIRATGTTISAELGKPFAMGGEWIVEPRFQVKYQGLRFRDFVDDDGLAVTLGTARQTSTRIGALVSHVRNPRLMPYLRVDLTHTSNGDPDVDVSSEAWDVRDRFGSGRVGNAVKVGAGLTSQLTRHVQLYGEANYQRFVGSYGLRGWAGNFGVRVTF